MMVRLPAELHLGQASAAEVEAYATEERVDVALVKQVMQPCIYMLKQERERERERGSRGEERGEASGESPTTRGCHSPQDHTQTNALSHKHNPGPKIGRSTVMTVRSQYNVH